MDRMEQSGLNRTNVWTEYDRSRQNGTQPNENWKPNLYLFVLLFVLKGIQRQYDQFF